jgi:hypothetical protein
MATPAEKESFSSIILKKTKEHGVNVIEAIMDHCETTGIEIEVAATLLNEELYQKMEKQAKVSNLLKKDLPPPVPVKKKKGKKK